VSESADVSGSGGGSVGVGVSVLHGAIAERVGYRWEFAFNRAFHRALGAPPGAYRKEHGR
jgi:hypothetical protein